MIPALRRFDEDAFPNLAEVDLIARHMAPQYRLTVYLQAAVGLRISETLAFSLDCVREDFIRIRLQVSAKAHRQDCRASFVPLKHRAGGVPGHPDPGVPDRRDLHPPQALGHLPKRRA
ncbi:hypothetical protein [Streptomyces sp. N35]|uniref:hypothetical protein n=1 Tax=Streptomyces sp. N35 TaxID=2795730 RepID=UPI001F33AB44|nr:hypothetical protein [Streptomyces sp. N35]